MTDKEYDFWAKIVEHLAWPGVAVMAMALFGDELLNFLKKIKKVEAGSVKFDLQAEGVLEEAKSLAVDPVAVAIGTTAAPVVVVPQVEVPAVPLEDVKLEAHGISRATATAELKDEVDLPPSSDPDISALDKAVSKNIQYAMSSSINRALRTKADMTSRPASQILEAWRNVEDAVAYLVSQLGVTLSPGTKSFNTNFKALQKYGSAWIDSEAINTILGLSVLRNKVAHTADFEPSYEAAENFKESAVIAITALFQGAARVVVEREAMAAEALRIKNMKAEDL